MRKILLAIFVFLLPSMAWGQGARLDSNATRNVQGFLAPIAGATITVCTSAATGTPCTPLVPTSPVTLCTDSTCSTAAPNPFFADSNGNFGFWALPGTYKVSITATGVTGQLLTVTLPCAAGISCLSNPVNLATQVTGTLAGANYAAVNLAGGNANGGVAGTLPGASYAAVNLAAGNVNGGVSGTLPAASVGAISLASSGNGGVTGVLPVANEGTGTPAASKYVDGGTGAWTALPSSGGYKIECINTTPVTVTNTASETVLMTCSIPANELGNNQTLRIHASGTNVTSATQTLTMRVRIGGLAGTQLGASDVAIANSSGGAWNLNFTVTANGAPSGSTATECQGMFVENNGTTTPLGTTLSNSATVSWATNSTLSLVITQAWSAAVTATLTERELIVERLN